MGKKRNTAIFIDGENIGAKKANQIFSVAKKCGITDYIKVYGRQKDNRTKRWSEVAKRTQRMKDIRLYGGPQKDKVDKKIQRDTLMAITRTPNIDIFLIVTSDHGYVQNIKELREKGKRVVVVGEDNSPVTLRNAGNEFILI